VNPNQTFVALEAVGFAFLGAAVAAVGQALVSGQTDWRVILGAALLAGLAKVFPSQVAAPHVPAPSAPAAVPEVTPAAAPAGQPPVSPNSL